MDLTELKSGRKHQKAAPVAKWKPRLFWGSIIVVVWGLGMWILIAHLLPRHATEEERIRHRIDQAIDAGRHREVGRLLGMVGADYDDELFSSKREVEEVLKYMYLRYKKVSVEVLEGPEIFWSEEYPDVAMATLRVRILLSTSTDLTAPPTDNSVQEARSTDFFRIHFRRIEGEWMIVSTQDH